MSEEKKSPPLTAGMTAAIDAAIAIIRDPTNRSVTCLCGVTYLSGAAEKDAEGRPLCIGCGCVART